MITAKVVDTLLDLDDLDVEGIKELIALELLVDEFAKAMKTKLRNQLRAGYNGWDVEKWASSKDPIEKLLDNVLVGDMVDVANFAAFIWNGTKNPCSHGIKRTEKCPACVRMIRRAFDTVFDPDEEEDEPFRMTVDCIKADTPTVNGHIYSSDLLRKLAETTKPNLPVMIGDERYEFPAKLEDAVGTASVKEFDGENLVIEITAIDDSLRLALEKEVTKITPVTVAGIEADASAKGNTRVSDSAEIVGFACYPADSFDPKLKKTKDFV